MFQEWNPSSQNAYESEPSSRQVVKFLTASTIGATLLFLSGLTLTGTVIALILATPILVLFSPVLVPAAITLFLVTTGFVFSGGCGVAAVAMFSWMYNFVTGKQPAPERDELDYQRLRMGDKATEYYGKHKGEEGGGATQPSKRVAL